MLLQSLFLSSVLGTTTDDWGQHHTHNPKLGVRDYKTGGPLTVHVVPHSHDDVGWLKTVDEYFDGSRRDIQWTNVNIELTSVIDALLDNKERKFSEVEMKFFKMWWSEQNDDIREKTKKLVKSGQLELINAGWSMHDEACPIYEDMINNMMIGHDWVLETFGVKPRIGWQIDPFGHSNTNARLFAEMGFDAWFFARLDYQDKNKRMNDKELEWVWRPNSESLGDDVQIFTHTLYRHYSSPQYMNFDVLDGDAPWINNAHSEDFNAPDEAAKLIAQIEERADHYLTDEVLMLFGDDFRYMNAFQNYQNMDAMIEYMNKNHGDKYKLRYSTPSDYVDAVAKHNVTWPTKYDDMFPYSDNPDAYWTGYFSSRANDKGYIRRASSNFHASNQLYAEKVLDKNLDDKSLSEILAAKYQLLDDLGINQHHDAVTGTGKQAVANDYAHRLFTGMEQNNAQYGKLINEKIKKMTGQESTKNWDLCFRTNSTYMDCPIANYADEKEYTMSVAVHNPSNVELSVAEIQVPHGNYTVQAFNTTTQSWVKPDASLVFYLDNTENDQTVVVFKILVDWPTAPRDFSLIQLTYTSEESIPIKQMNMTDHATIDSKEMSLEFLGEQGKGIAFEMTDKKSGRKEIIDFNIGWWASWVNYNAWNGGQNSGDYIFRPLTGQFETLHYSDFQGGQGAESPEGTLFSFYFLNGTERQVIVHVSIDQDLQVIKFVVDMDSLPEVDVDGYEVVAEFSVRGFQNNKTFYTDSNGLEMQKRILNYRPTWDIQANYNDSLENITANFYPINSAISMQDGERVFTVTNDRSQAGSALSEGAIQFMQNRRIPADDGRGMGEWLDEKDELGRGIRVSATYYIDLFNSTERQSRQRLIQQRQDDAPQYFFNFDLQKSAQKGEPTTLGKALAYAGIKNNVKMVSLPVDRNVITVRLENIADVNDLGESPAKKERVAFKWLLQQMWKSANGVQSGDVDIQIKEKSLTGNMDIEEMRERKIQWKTKDDAKVNKKISYHFDGDYVDLEPQRIRVFEVTFGPKPTFDDMFLQ